LIRHIWGNGPKCADRMRQLKLAGLLLFTVILVSSCSPHGSKRINRGFYYWKSNFRLERADDDTLTRLGVSYLYIKFFDVVWSNGAKPVSKIRFTVPPPPHLRVVPTVFITNDTFKKITSASVADLAHKISFKIRRICATNGLPLFEIQIDCDWTDSTRQKYFDLLKQLQKELRSDHIQISATIRLHQIKYYRRTGVPPVDRGVLMFYNMADPTDYDTDNSILDLNIARRYTQNLRCYPLSLDVALPLFSWGVVFQDRRFIGLARGYRRVDLKRPAFEPYRERFFRATANVYLHGTQLYRGDLIRIEESTYDQCRQSAAWIKRNLKPDPHRRVLFFHFDQTDIGVMGLEKLDQIYRSCH
jgi:hypothetical protein